VVQSAAKIGTVEERGNVKSLSCAYGRDKIRGRPKGKAPTRGGAEGGERRGLETVEQTFKDLDPTIGTEVGQ